MSNIHCHNCEKQNVNIDESAYTNLIVTMGDYDNGSQYIEYDHKNNVEIINDYKNTNLLLFYSKKLKNGTIDKTNIYGESFPINKGESIIFKYDDNKKILWMSKREPIRNVHIITIFSIKGSESKEIDSKDTYGNAVFKITEYRNYGSSNVNLGYNGNDFF